MKRLNPYLGERPKKIPELKNSRKVGRLRPAARLVLDKWSPLFKGNRIRLMTHLSLFLLFLIFVDCPINQFVGSFVLIPTKMIKINPFERLRQIPNLNK